MSLPNVSKSQVDEMNALAEKKMQEEYGMQSVEENTMESGNDSTELHGSHEKYAATEEQSYEEDTYEEEEVEQEPEVTQPVSRKFSQATELNIREMRLLKEQSDKELAKSEYEKSQLMKALLEYKQGNQQVAKPVVEQDEFEKLDDNELIEGKHHKSMAAYVKSLEKKIERIENNTKEITFKSNEAHLRSSFPDFDKVMTTENLNQLEALNPELAETILKNDNPHTQKKLAYQMIKQFGIYKEDIFSQDKKLAQMNAAKPKGVASLSPKKGDSVLGMANAFAEGMTQDQSRALYIETRRAANNAR
jgi:hypothetical protein